MPEVVDSIVAELIARDNGYTATFDKIIAKHRELIRTGDQVALGQKRYEDQHRQSVSKVASDEEQATERVKRTRKARSDAAIQADNAEVQSAKRTADARIREAERAATREAQLDENARRRIIHDRTVQPGSGGLIGRTVARDGGRIPESPIAAATAADVVAQKEVNHALADEYDLRQRSKVLQGEELRQVEREIALLQRRNVYLRAGLTEEEAFLRAEREIAVVEAQRARREVELAAAQRAGRRGGLGGANEFALSATGGRFGYSFSPGAVAGLAAGVGVAITSEAIQHAVDYGKELKNVAEQTGLNTSALQVYQAAATRAGVSQDQLRSALGQFANNLGRAREGSEEQIKLFKALGVSIRGTASAGDLLPTLIDRISSIKDPAQQAAVATRLFGEEGRRLLPILAGGNEPISALADEMQRAGKILSPADIQKLDDAAKKFEEVKAQLNVDLATTVAQNAEAIKSIADTLGYLAGKALSAAAALTNFNSAYYRNLSTNLKVLSNDPVGYIEMARNLRADQEAQQQQLRNKSLADGRALFSSVQPGSVNNDLLAKLGAPKGPRGPSAETLARRAEERQKYFDSTLAAANADILRARQQVTADEDERARLSREELEIENQRKIDDIRHNGKIKGLRQDQIDTLVRRQEEAGRAEAGTVNFREDVRHDQEEAQIASQRIELQRDVLETQASLARTAKERLAKELELLDLAKKQEEILDRPILDDAQRPEGMRRYSAQQIAEAQERAATREARFGVQEEERRRQNMGPWAAYVDSLPRTADEIGEAFQRAQVDGVERLNDSLEKTIGKMLHLHGVAGEFLNDLIQIGLHALEAQIFGGGSGAGAEGSGSGAGAFIAGAVKTVGAIFGLANEGGFEVGGNGGVDRNLLSINGRPRAWVSGDERVSVGRPNMALANSRVRPLSYGPNITLQQQVHIDASGVNPEGYTAGLVGLVRTETAKAIADSQRQTLQMVPQAMAGYQQNGTVRRY